MMAEDDDGRVLLHLGGQGLDPRALADALVQLDRLVKSLDSDAALTLTTLSTGSAKAGMRLDSDARDDLRDGLSELARVAIQPPGWTRESLSAVAGFDRVSTARGVTDIRLEIDATVAEIDSAIRANAAAALEQTTKSLGGVRGTVYRYINDPSGKRRNASLRRSDTGEAIKLHFSAANAALVRGHLEDEVEVWGTVARDATDQIVHITVEGIERVGSADELPVSGRGLLGRDWTDGMDPVDWVRAQRD